MNEIDFMPEPAKLLEVGNRVINGAGQTGIVLLAGPYGDQPFQVKLYESEDYCGGVYGDGTVHQSPMVWEIVYV